MGNTERLVLAKEVLEGLSVGDAIGEALSYQYYRCRELSDFSSFRPGTVRFTDDTEMAIALVETLERLEGVDEDVLAWAFASRYRKDPERGYGKMARRILKDIGDGLPWEDVSRRAFGAGSFGNGAAMRVAPLGAYFSGNLASVPAMATRSARVTHYHPEGIAGAIAVAAAAAAATRSRGMPTTEAVNAIWYAVLTLTPESNVRSRLGMVHGFEDVEAVDVAKEIGNGTEVSAQDTVPFCIWSACQTISDYQESILRTLEVGGDCDTNCAIVGGIVVGYAGSDSIPVDWLRARETIEQKR